MRKGYDVFLAEPGQGEAVRCRVCGTICQPVRRTTEPVGDASRRIAVVAQRPAGPDRLVCPHVGKHWHDQALDLMLAIERMPNPTLAEVMRGSLASLLQEHGIQA